MNSETKAGVDFPIKGSTVEFWTVSAQGTDPKSRDKSQAVKVEADADYRKYLTCVSTVQSLLLNIGKRSLVYGRAKLSYLDLRWRWCTFRLKSKTTFLREANVSVVKTSSNVSHCHSPPDANKSAISLSAPHHWRQIIPRSRVSMPLAEDEVESREFRNGSIRESCTEKICSRIFKSLNAGNWPKSNGKSSNK